MARTACYYAATYRHMPTVRLEDRIPAVVVTEEEGSNNIAGVALPNAPWLHIDNHGVELVWSINLHEGRVPGWFILRNGEFRPVEP